MWWGEGGEKNQALKKTFQYLLKMVNIKLPHNQAIPLLAIYQRENKTHIKYKNFTKMFRASLFIIAKNERTQMPVI